VHTLGRYLQGLGLALLPLALYLGLAYGERRGAMTLELSLLGAGAAVFLLGRWVERRAR